MVQYIKTLVLKVYNYLLSFFYDIIYVGEYASDRNFGDALNYVVLEKLFKSKIVAKRFCFKKQWMKNDNLLFIGSIIRCADERSIVWGAGIISRNDIINNVKKICSVRGPYTRNLCLNQGFDCPEVYGDPALLLPRFYFPNFSVKYKIGFIPHFLDKHKFVVEAIKHMDGVHFIDIQTPKTIFRPSICKYYKKFVDEVLSCDVIISSALHGLILGDAYGKKTLWIKFGNDIGGDDVKFYDYYGSMGIIECDIKPYYIRSIDDISLNIVNDRATKKPIEKVDMEKFLNQNPYLEKL